MRLRLRRNYAEVDMITQNNKLTFTHHLNIEKIINFNTTKKTNNTFFKKIIFINGKFVYCYLEIQLYDKCA